MFLLLSHLAMDSNDIGMSSPRSVPKGPPPAGYDAPVHPQLATPIGNHQSTLVQVLDVNLDAGLVAFKLINFVEGWSAMGIDPASCGYPGMEERPNSGVTLALFKVNEATVESWNVYALAMDDSECTPHAESEKRLAAAKKAFSDVGLDITRKPEGEKPDDQGVFTLGRSSVQTWSFKVSSQDESFLKWTGQEPGIGYAHTKNGLTMNGKVLVAFEETYETNGAGMTGTDFPRVWSADGKAIFLVRTWYFHMRGGLTEHWTFTPVVTLQ